MLKNKISVDQKLFLRYDIQIKQNNGVVTKVS